MHRFTLILATVGRVEEPDKFLEALTQQSFQDFEVIVVDQNSDDRLTPILDRYRKDLSIEVAQQEATGLSRARNTGLKLAKGEIIAFPDDDCWYAPDVLERVDRRFGDNGDWNGMSGRAYTADGEALTGRGEDLPRTVDSRSVWRLCIEFTMFIRRTTCNEIGLFDETLGPNSGTPWGAGEDTDYLLRALKAGACLHYDPEVRIYHPDWTINYGDEAIAKAYSYAQGMGRVLRMHRYPPWRIAYYLFRPLAGSAIGAVTLRPMKARFHMARFMGRARGWMAKL